MAEYFNYQLDQLSEWRRAMRLRLRDFCNWLSDHDLQDDSSQELVQRLTDKLNSDKLTVVFVAEFSRGKSELINAVFFAQYGRRIMPASVGRTTMCPTELGYDAHIPPCLRLLPIETRLKPQTLMDWRMVPEQWTRVDLDLDDPDQLVQAMEKVSEVLYVSQEQARALGFWYDDRPQDNPRVDANGLVEVPKWRHALLNFAHPLLKQGLVIWDTPGLNAIGVEPELTMNLIGQAQAVVFILAADTGVTKSDLTIWHDYLAPQHESTKSRFVVLNKIDTIWDGLSHQRQIDKQIQRQCAEVASVLELAPEQVFALSAQKGLLAKIRDDQSLFSRSCLGQFERMLGQRLLDARYEMLSSSVQSILERLYDNALRIIRLRRSELNEQLLEFQSLQGKNKTVIRQMQLRVQREKSDFDYSVNNVLAVRFVHMKLLREVIPLLGSASLKKELSEVGSILKTSGIKVGIKQAYIQGFKNLRGILKKVESQTSEIRKMLSVSYRQLSTEFGFALQVPKQPSMVSFLEELNVVESSHVRHLSVSNMFYLAHSEYAEKLWRALLSRIYAIFASALSEVELWSKSCSAQLNSQLRERRSAYTRRVEAMNRIQGAVGGLGVRISELEQQNKDLNASQRRLDTLIRSLQEHSLEISRAVDVGCEVEAV